MQQWFSSDLGKQRIKLEAQLKELRAIKYLENQIEQIQAGETKKKYQFPIFFSNAPPNPQDQGAAASAATQEGEGEEAESGEGEGGLAARPRRGAVGGRGCNRGGNNDVNYRPILRVIKNIIGLTLSPLQIFFMQ